MLFKTISASVYGIDAYLVEVEVDVGSARMQDFNVVGLPDNAVKESRERIKSALRNCGYEFPYGQGVTINLAPADLRKEGSAFDLPMALGLAGCQGQFFGKTLDKMMFLGELSLDGSVRAVLLMEPWLCYNGGTYEDNSLRGDGGGKRSAESHTRHVRMAHKLLCEKNVKITALDWLDCLKSVELTSDDFVTMDMPYIGTDPGAYSSESVCPTEVIEQLRNAPYRWAFCEYPQPLYCATLGEPVYKKDVLLRATMLRHVRERRTECLWVGGKSSPSVTVTVPTPVPEGRSQTYYKSLSVEALLKEIQECIGSISYHRNQMNREMRERLLPALLELRKRTYRKRPGFYESLAKIGLNADTVRQWFYRSNTADEAVELLEETPPESVRREHSDGQSPEELLLEHADRMAKAILAGKLTHAKKLASQYLETRNEGQVRTEPEAA